MEISSFKTQIVDLASCKRSSDGGGKKWFLSPANINVLLSLFQTLFPTGRKKKRNSEDGDTNRVAGSVVNIPREVLSVPLVAGVRFIGRRHNAECCQRKYETANPYSHQTPFRCFNLFVLLLKLRKKTYQSFLAVSPSNFSNCCEFNKAYLLLSLGNKANAVTSSMR